MRCHLFEGPCRHDGFVASSRDSLSPCCMRSGAEPRSTTWSGNPTSRSASQSPFTVSDQFGTFWISSRARTKPCSDLRAAVRACSHCRTSHRASLRSTGVRMVSVVSQVGSVARPMVADAVPGSGASTATWTDGRWVRSRTCFTIVVFPVWRGPTTILSHRGSSRRRASSVLVCGRW